MPNSCRLLVAHGVVSSNSVAVPPRRDFHKESACCVCVLAMAADSCCIPEALAQTPTSLTLPQQQQNKHLETKPQLRGVRRRHRLFHQDETTNGKLAEGSDIRNDLRANLSPSGTSPASQVRDPHLTFSSALGADSEGSKASCLDLGLTAMGQ